MKLYKLFKILAILIYLFVSTPLGQANNGSLSEIETAIIEEDYAQAKKLAQEYISAYTNQTSANDARYYLGLSQIHLGQYREARDVFNELMKNNPSQPLQDKASIGLLDSYFMEERYEDAFKVSQKLLKQSKRSEFLSLIYLKVARVHLKLTRWDEARDYLKRIVHDFPESLEAHLARQLLEEKQFFAVQVGSFLDRERAEKLMTELKDKGEYAYIVETSDKDHNEYYRVRVGQLAKLGDAQELRTHLSDKGYPTQIYP